MTPATPIRFGILLSVIVATVVEPLLVTVVDVLTD